MASKPISRSEINEHDVKRSWWVKIVEETGRILSISSRPIRPDILEDTFVFECWNTLCGDILQGKIAKKWVGAVYDIEDKTWNIAVRGKNLVIEVLGNKLHEVDNSLTPNNSDVYLKIFEKENKIQVAVNLQNIKRTMNLMDIESVRKADGALLNLYFCGKNDPDYLISSVEMDPFILFSKGNVIIDMPEVSLNRDWKDISIYTRPIFHKYGFEVTSDRFDSNTRLSSSTVLNKAYHNRDGAHLTVYKDGPNSVRFYREIKEDQEYVVQGLKHLSLIVCDKDPDNYVGGVTIPGDVIREKDNFQIQTDFTWPKEPLIVFKNKNIKINYLGEKNHAQLN